MKYVLSSTPDAIAVYGDGVTLLAACRVHRMDGCIYIDDLWSDGDAGALKALVEATCEQVKGENAYLAVDAREPAMSRLCKLYERIATLEYLMFKVKQ